MLWIGLGIGLISIALGVIVIGAQRKSFTNWTFGVFAINIGIWIISIFITVYAFTSLLGGRTAIASSIVALAALLLFAIVFPDKNPVPALIAAIVLLPALFFTIISFTPYMVQEVHIENSSLHGTFGSARDFYKFFPPLYVLTTLGLLIKKFIASRDEKKVQLKIVLSGIGFSMVPILITNAVLPAFHIYQLNALGPLFMVYMVAFASYAILKHQFLNVKIIIQRSIVYSLSLAVVASFYLVVAARIAYAFQTAAHISALIAGFATSLAGISFFPFLEKYFRRITDKIFFKDKYDYREALHELSEILNHHIEEKDIVDKSTEALVRILKTKSAVFARDGAQTFIPDTRDPADKFVVPIFIDKKVVGILRVGEKKSGDQYTAEDIRLLHTFAHQFSVALAKARLYEEVKKYSLELESRVRERTAQLTTLQEAQHQMMVDISHHLQTPLTILKSQLGALRTQIASPENRRTIDMVEKTIDEISAMTYNLLHLAQLETSTEPLTKDDVDLTKLLHDTLEYITILTEEKKITLESSVAPNVHIIGKKDKLEEMVTNLISNSIKYMRVRGVKKISAILAKDEKNKKAIFTVSDTGMGIPADDLPYIFERFYKVRQASKAHIKGTGLGLSIVRTIVEKHNGTIKVHSTPNKGTSFIVTFPCQ